ncbi:hypothetical protein CLV94_1924 [Flavobacterium endophyticum]|uniref:Outer membrane beta-barrel porin/alpha-amylase n=1 Tax=Flavobacterium endophyticum TaxID=1540163 RepID=A0A495MLN9_9FLAO|nr:hypothetical protein [Flavobacterium endophyticum]RKS26854.1 hypothetical protein CLV94_1924 [Flavobacterium endophyticum]
MKIKILLFCLFLSLKGSSQKTATNTVTQTYFEGANIVVLASQILPSQVDPAISAFEVKFLDYADNKIKYYDAPIVPKGYISITTEKHTWPIKNCDFMPISIITIPFKVRPSIQKRELYAKADIKNIGIYYPFQIATNKRLWFDGKTTEHKFSYGLMIAPMVEELSDKNTNNHYQDPLKTDSTLMLSTSLAGTYTYQAITFSIIPLGVDMAINSNGKNWVYNGKYWWGFAIGLDTKLFGF